MIVAAQSTLTHSSSGGGPGRIDQAKSGSAANRSANESTDDRLNDGTEDPPESRRSMSPARIAR